MLLFTLMSLSISLVKADQKRPSDLGETLGAHVALGQLTLNEMFKEVEKLMEDTQQKLEEAVHQMANETSRSLYGYRLPFGHPNANVTGAKESESASGEALSSPLPIPESRWNEVDHECLIDEDCEKDSFCLYNISSSKCVLCKSTNMECVKDEECCGEQLCVWGACTQNKTRGDSGTICQYQSDCSPLHCCAIHKALLFPVCRPRPLEGQRCQEQPNELLELLMWDEEAPHEHCPCAAGLQCQLLGKESLCLKQKKNVHTHTRG
ncbi:dickkopf-related protein 3b [Clarias gariepinus]|uniref:dickkopf-related protein 3b n=1 Tax=Clarias gariepinus TaxID=13013 RepID=UPI00234C5B42|nr:dickkopf-related protein 3b [Clarias gariepinus]